MLNVSEQYLYQVLRGLSTARPALARQLHGLDPQMLLWDLRPNDWHIVWPELVGTEGAPPAPADTTPHQEAQHAA